MNIIITDLDGTLLELESYSLASTETTARAAIKAGLPLIFCSSKTRTEQVYYQHLLDLRAPFIVENGSAIIIPKDYFALPFNFDAKDNNAVIIELGCRVEVIRKHLRQICKDLGCICLGYDDLSLPEICELTGLTEAAAARASQRDYSGTILSTNASAEVLHTLQVRLAKVGLECVQGSRFYTITGQGANKGLAVRRLLELFQQQYDTIYSIGLGDGANDLPMLAEVDEGYLVQKPDRTWINASDADICYVNAVGPLGWSQVVQGHLQRKLSLKTDLHSAS
jgi:mannosyl-3-phosphoglycerate phosphatase family protein